MIRFFLALAFALSLIALPWWASLLCAILYLAEGGSPLLVIVGGIIFDAMFGTPIKSLWGFSFLYSTYAVLLSIVAIYLKKELFE
jgi:hypothetical protein